MLPSLVAVLISFLLSSFSQGQQKHPAFLKYLEAAYSEHNPRLLDNAGHRIYTLVYCLTPYPAVQSVQKCLREADQPHILPVICFDQQSGEY